MVEYLDRCTRILHQYYQIDNGSSSWSYDISESFLILERHLVPAMWGQEVEVRSYGHNAVRIDGAMAQLPKYIETINYCHINVYFLICHFDIIK